MSPVTVPGLRYAAVLSREAELRQETHTQSTGPTSSKKPLPWHGPTEQKLMVEAPPQHGPTEQKVKAEATPQHGPTEQKPKAEARPPAWPSGVSTVPFTGASSRLVQQSGIWWSRTKLTAEAPLHHGPTKQNLCRNVPHLCMAQ